MSQGPIRLEVTAHSPVDLMVTDPDGKRIGFDVASKRVIDEILGASFTGHGSEPETVRIPAPVAGAYDIGVEGIASGSFTIDVQTIDGASNVIDSAHFAGTATVGSEDVLPVHLSSDGGLGSGPPSPPADTTAPTIACDAANDAWHASDVSLHCTAADGGSGLANADDASFSLSTHVADGTETSDAKTDSRQVCDKAGNCATAGPIGGNKVDKKAPTIVIASPASDAAYTVGQSVAANYQCNDEGSGVASCAGPVANGAAIDTASVGAKSLAVAARDAAGNEANRLVAYSVGYGICTLYDQTQVKKLGSTVPIKLQLCNAAGLNLSSPAVVVHATGLVRVSDNVSGTVQDSGNANPDSDFRYDAGLGGSGGYIFNLSTKALTPGTWSVRIAVSGDPTAHEVQFQVR
jgi:hypothetical protein